VTEGQPLQVVELQPGLVYKVKKGTWHNLLATKEAVFAIVENRDTDVFDVEIGLWPAKSGKGCSGRHLDG